MSNNIISNRATALFNSSLVMDNSLGFEPEIEVPYKWDILHRYLNAGFSYVTLSIATDATSLERTLLYMSEQIAKINAEADKFILVKNIDDILRAKQENKLALGFMFQGTNPIAKNLDMVDIYYQLGVRSMILSYNARNAVGDGCAEISDAGLSRFGRKLIEKMNQVGMIIDLSHVGRKTSMDVMEISQAPVIFSHSDVYAIHPHARNLNDQQIKACAETGGFIGINGIGLSENMWNISIMSLNW
jgi:membrane dipeptidase